MLVVCKNVCFSLGAVDAGEDLVGILGAGEGWSFQVVYGVRTSRVTPNAAALASIGCVQARDEQATSRRPKANVASVRGLAIVSQHRSDSNSSGLCCAGLTGLPDAIGVVWP
jgi:hypothetical protein